ncbi:circularly permuted type 2 ATP-grasp protein [Dermacoccus sp. GAS27A]|uniref:circularly permuted type 2 ATP-grasp protein n=1 Tax=Dermacoccus sp. GAS27A TaxID=3156270 RepID=UPI0038378CB1
MNASAPPPAARSSRESSRPSAIDADASDETGCDEALADDGSPRAAYRAAAQRFSSLGAAELRTRQKQAEAIEQAEGITFRVTGEDEPRVFPIDPFPRIIDPDTWATLSAGLEQRARALNAFLDDVYGPRRIVEAGIVEQADLERSPGYVDEGRLQPPGAVRAHICGMDLVCTEGGRWLVLEDNLRVPSGLVFSHVLREITQAVHADVAAPYDLHDQREAFDMLRETLRVAAPQHASSLEQPRLALVSAGSSDSAWFEHRRIAELVGMPVCTPADLVITDGRLHHRDADGTYPIDVVYARIEKDLLFTAEGADGVVLGPGLEMAIATGRVAFVNTFGNGVGDDKAIYALVPEMIRFYLDEEPLLEQVPTDRCHEPGKLEHVIDHLAERVVKPVDGYGGSGITVGPECSQAELDERADELRAHPERFIAQDVIRLSTLPTYAAGADGEWALQRRHVDLRAFVHVRQARPAPGHDDTDGRGVNAANLTAHTVPAALTRTAPAGSLIVNSSRGGGGKDTWILRSDVGADDGPDA